MHDDNILLQLLLGTAFVALVGLVWHSLGSADVDLDDTPDESVPTADDIQAHCDKLESERRDGEDRRRNDPALPYVGEGHERRQRTRRQSHA